MKKRGRPQTAAEDKIPLASAAVCNLPSAVSLPPVLAKICELLGQQRYDLWFGSDTTYEVKDHEVVFTVRNNFAINSIKCHCTPEIEKALCECQIGSGLMAYSFQERVPGKTREEEVNEAMASAQKLNAEARAKKIPTADECITVSIKDGTFCTTEFIPSWLTNEEKKSLRKQVNQRVKELFDEYEKTRQLEILTH